MWIIVLLNFLYWWFWHLVCTIFFLHSLPLPEKWSGIATNNIQLYWYLDIFNVLFSFSLLHCNAHAATHHPITMPTLPPITPVTMPMLPSNCPCSSNYAATHCPVVMWMRPPADVHNNGNKSGQVAEPASLCYLLHCSLLPKNDMPMPVLNLTKKLVQNSKLGKT